jgi:FtsH-binding integral membrane protein
MNVELPGWLARLTSHPLSLRNVAVVLSVACAAVYFAIGLGLIYRQPSEGVQLWLFGFSSALAFALGAALLLAAPGRVVWSLGALFMVFVILAYVGVAPRRDPSYEMWGISLKIAQAVILVALLGLLTQDRRKSVA